MKIGKLSNEELQRLVLDRLPRTNSSVLHGPGVGLDAAAIRFGEGYVVVSSDPITGATAEIGKLAVHITCNDIAACGIRPSALTMVLIAPPHFGQEDIKAVVDQAGRTAAKLDVNIVGGHTEVSDAVNRCVVMMTAFGFAKGQEIISASGGKAGDAVLMTKTAGLEGTAILAHEKKSALSGLISQPDLARAAGFIEQISVVEEGLIGGQSGVHAMHDATEGGILGACWELATAAGLGCLIEKNAILLDPLTTAICQALGCDPLRLIASGSMLMTTDRPGQLKEQLDRAGIRSSQIGHLTTEMELLVEEADGRRVRLEQPGPDELYKII